ncbi:T9SS type A sorting domain-containing protein [Bacteroidota bacterium]
MLFHPPKHRFYTITVKILPFRFSTIYFSQSNNYSNLTNKAMIEVYNLDGMPVYKYRSEENKDFEISELETKGLPCGVYFVKVMTSRGVETSKLLIC